jgi:hypothetical protein
MIFAVLLGGNFKSPGRMTVKRSLFLIICTFFLSNLIPAASPSQERPKQEVTVTAVEVPVRVLHKGDAVKDLTKEDFEGYENGVRQEIKAFQIISRKIAIEKGEDVAQIVSRLKDLFMQADITFHLILMKSLRTLLSQDFELTEVAEDYEDCFRKISASTGRYAAFSNKVLDVLKEASVKEDYHYLIVYSPEDSSGAKERNIDVKVRREGVDVISLKQFLAREQSLIMIADFKAGQKNINFNLKNYARINAEGKFHGTADVKIVLFDDKSDQAFSDGKTLDLLKEETHISLNFSHLKSGFYFIIIDAYDRITGGKDVYSSAIRL